jgi:hypothetical protein
MEFKIPIEYNSHGILQNHIVADLELDKLYRKLFKNDILINKYSRIYSTNKKYISQTQKFINDFYSNKYDFDDFYNEHKNFIEDKNFIDKYQYINLGKIKNLNNSHLFMQALSLYNISAPVISLCTPIFVLVIPYFILRFKKIEIEMDTYCILIKKMIENNNMFKILSNESTMNEKFSGIFTIVFYIFQIYQNTLSCISFYNNLNYIGDFILKYKIFCSLSIKLIDEINNNCISLSKYRKFINNNNIIKSNLEGIIKKLSNILVFNNSLSRLLQVGRIMSVFYDLFTNKAYHRTIEYMYRLSCFNNDTKELAKYVSENKLNRCYIGNETKIENMYYLNYIDKSCIKNDINVKDNIMITGPNASGKTTFIKTLMINLIMSQHFGFGCYSKATIKVYNYFHSYLNIPDTSGRDSLFQAEARRCKDILEFITKNKNKKHFCIFDEIYSGTNPQDATLCAKIYLKGLSKINNLDFVLTTHYIELCKYFEENKINISNYRMKVNMNNSNIEYKYILEDGISEINGGKQILIDLDYPSYLFDL